MDDAQRHALKHKLLAEAESLRACLESGAEAAAPVQLDQASVGRLSRMDAMQSQAMAIETRRRQQLALRRIEISLTRIDASDFGYCVDCDEPIDPRRLLLNPTLTCCTRCASVRESSS